MTGKVALITGGARGLGAAAALRMAIRGWTIAVSDIDSQSAISNSSPEGTPRPGVASSL